MIIVDRPDAMECKVRACASCNAPVYKVIRVSSEPYTQTNAIALCIGCLEELASKLKGTEK